MTASDCLESTWTAIKAQVGGDPGWYHRRLSISAPGNLYAAIQRPSNLRRISLEVPVVLEHEFTPPTDAKGFHVAKDTHGHPGGIVTIHIAETGSASTEVFNVFSTDLLTQYARHSNLTDSIRVLWRRMLCWKRFFETYAVKTISREAYTGLLGELVFIAHLFDHGVDGGRVIAGWQGPEREVQDFQFGSCAVEVKTSLAVQMATARISNVRQLDDAGLNHLFLCCQSGDLREGSGQTLTAIVSRLVQKLGSDFVTVASLEEGLMSAGVIWPDSTAWANCGFHLAHRSHYLVRDGFPRLLTADIPLGINDVKYSIEISQCAPFICADADVIRAIEEALVHVGK